MPFKKGSKRPRGKRVYRKRGVKKGKQLVTKAQLYKAIHKNIENKIALAEQTFTLHNSAINNADFYMVLPQVPNGTSASNRIGDEIRPRSLIIRGVMTYNAISTNGYFDPQMIISRLFCCQQKGIRDFGYINSVSTQLLQNGASGLSYTGALLDNTRPKNTDVFTFYADRKHTFLKPYGLTGTSAASITCMDKSLVYYFTIKFGARQLPAVLKYNGSGATYPTNFLPLMAVGYSYAQNQSPDISNTQIGLSWTSTLTFEDA